MGRTAHYASAAGCSNRKVQLGWYCNEAKQSTTERNTTMALGSHCSCVVPEKRERSPGSWGLERAPAGAPRGRWRSTEIIDLFLLESCAVDATQGSLRSGRPAMGAFLASKPNPQYRATERAHGRGPGAGVCVCGRDDGPRRGGNYRAPGACARVWAHMPPQRVSASSSPASGQPV
jgi:hypothetical protein